MALVTHITHLQDKHSQLELNIAAESARPMPDFAVITQLKKQKLALKEEIARLNKDSPPQKRKHAS